MLVGVQTGAGTVENMEVPQKVRNQTTLRSSNCITRYLPKEYETTDSKGYLHRNVHSSIIYNGQVMEMVQEDMIYISRLE